MESVCTAKCCALHWQLQGLFGRLYFKILSTWYFLFVDGSDTIYIIAVFWSKYWFHRSNQKDRFSNGKEMPSSICHFACDHFFEMSYKSNSSKLFNKNFTFSLSFELLSDVQFRRYVFRVPWCINTHINILHLAVMINTHTLWGHSRECASFINIL